MPNTTRLVNRNELLGLADKVVRFAGIMAEVSTKGKEVGLTTKYTKHTKRDYDKGII